MTFPIKLKVLKVTQQIGSYFVCVITARTLLEVCYSDKLFATYNPEKLTYDLDGTQREIRKDRLNSIADYINRVDSAFPNSIILAANYRQEDGLIESEPEDPNSPNARWDISQEKEDYFLTIPTNRKLAAVIDGQHRLFSYVKANSDRLNDELICSVFFDLPKPIQASLFAVINSTQKPVNKSQTYELFGYNINEEEEKFWSPDKLAVFITRKLNLGDPPSPLKGKVIISAAKDSSLHEMNNQANWRVSTAVIVDSILKLISSNPIADNNFLLSEASKNTREHLKNSSRRDQSPLRDLYLSNQDLQIYKVVFNYLSACEELFWSKMKPESFICRTAGIYALFDVLKVIVKQAFQDKDISRDYFVEKLKPAQDIDFSRPEYKQSSGAGRGVIRNAILNSMTNSKDAYESQ